MTYTYCLQIGRFPGPVADEECFALVVTPALQAGAPGLWFVGEAAGWGTAPEAGAVGMAAALPPSAALHAAAPNPFAGRAALGYDLPEAGPVRLAVYDLLGREVAVLVDAEQAAGRHEAVLDGRGLPDGTYLVVMTAAGGFTRTQRVTLIH